MLQQNTTFLAARNEALPLVAPLRHVGAKFLVIERTLNPSKKGVLGFWYEERG